IGGRLVDHGAASLLADTLVLQASGLPSSTALFLQSASGAPGNDAHAFGDGVSCFGSQVLRLATRPISGGTGGFPQAGEPSPHVRGLIVQPGTYLYQVWYRNSAGFCTPATFNITSGVRIDWAP